MPHAFPRAYADAMAMTLNVLGGFSLLAESGLAISVPRNKARALLCYLMVNTPQRQSRTRLCDLLWTRSDPGPAGNSLRQIVSHLRSVLPDHERYLDFKRDSLALIQQCWTSDVLQLQAAGRSPCLYERQSAFDRYRGELMAGFDVAEDAFEEWLLLERRKAEAIAIDLGLSLVNGYRQKQNFQAMSQIAIQLIELDPYAEDHYRQAMRGLVRLGRNDEAQDIYQTLRQRLRDDLGQEPQPETVRMLDGLKRSPAPVLPAVHEDGRRCAIDHLQSAARLLSDQGAHAMAADSYANAFALNESLDDPVGRSVNLLLGLYREKFILGAFGEAGTAAGLALDSAGAADRPVSELVRAELAVANCERVQGRLMKALLHGRNAVVMAARADAGERNDLQVRANLSVGASHFMLGNYGAAFPLLHENIAMIGNMKLDVSDEAEPGLPLLRTFGWYIWCCSEMGKFELGEHVGQEACRRAADEGDIYSLNNCRIALGVLLLHRGAFDAAGEILAQADRSVQSAQIDGLVPMVRMPMAMCLAETGNLQQAQETVLSVANWPELPIVKAGLAMISAHRGASAAAEHLAREGLALARSIGAKGDEGWCWLSLASAQRSRGKHLTADDALDRAASISRRLGMAPLGAFCKSVAYTH